MLRKSSIKPIKEKPKTVIKKLIFKVIGWISEKKVINKNMGNINNPPIVGVLSFVKCLVGLSLLMFCNSLNFFMK